MTLTYAQATYKAACANYTRTVNAAKADLLAARAALTSATSAAARAEADAAFLAYLAEAAAIITATRNGGKETP